MKYRVNRNGRIVEADPAGMKPVVREAFLRMVTPIRARRKKPSVSPEAPSTG